MNPRGLISAILILIFITGCESENGTTVGTLERYRISLTAEVSEPIADLAVREGDFVEAGQLVVRLDSSLLDAQISQAQAGLTRTQRRLDELVRGPRQETILETRAAVAESQAQVINTEEEFERVETLVSRQLLPQARLDEARALRDSARAKLEGIRARLTAQLEGTTIEELDQARAAVEEAAAALERIKIQRQRLQLRAPQASRVEALPFRVGEQPAAGKTLAVLLANNPVFAKVYVHEAMRAHLNAGDQAIVYVAGRENPLQGKIRFLSSEANFTPFYALTEYDRGRLTYLAEIDILGDTENLPTGVPVSVSFPSLND
jgi:HlyD family secretion protein